MLNPEKKFLLTHSLTWGCGCGAAMLITLLAASYSASNPSEFSTSGIVQYLILSLGIYFCIFYLIRKIGQENCTFKRMFFVGLICGVSASLFIDLYITIYVKMINPNIVDITVQESMKILQQSKIYNEEQLQLAGDAAQRMFVPMQILVNTILYGFLSAISSSLSAYMIRARFNKNY